ncbi:MAG: efflux transporter outer membrane subunit [Alphaproteobacteria bacterium]|nr:efflux transporter outer membrane subunit [Alphaproteobacteria bacterium]
MGILPGDVPAAFTGPIPVGAQVWPQTNWWHAFASPELAAYEDTAQSANLDLAAAAARVLQAQAQTGIAGSALFPDLTASASANRGGGPKPTPTANRFSVSAQATYQVDLWGQARNNLRAAEETLRSSQFAQETVALTVAADVANTYFNVLALRERIAITEQNIAAAKRILAITQAKVTNGVSSNLDLAQQQAQLAGQEAQLPALQEQEREARYALAILEGRSPEGFDVAAKDLNGVNPPPVAPGLPSELLERRPDIAGAEANLASAHASVDAARAAFFPQIGLTGSAGFASTMLSHLFNPSSFVWDIGASLLETIFNGGLHAAQSDLAKGREKELIATYRSTVLNAFSDTESALGQVSSNADAQKYTQDEVNAAAEAFRISELQYREGVTDLLSVLQAQQTLFTSENALVQVKLARLQAVVSLYQALGGGWTVAATPKLPDANPLRLF